MLLFKELSSLLVAPGAIIRIGYPNSGPGATINHRKFLKMGKKPNSGPGATIRSNTVLDSFS